MGSTSSSRPKERGRARRCLPPATLVTGDETVVVLSADHPLVDARLIDDMLASHRARGCGGDRPDDQGARPDRVRADRARGRRVGRSHRRDEAHGRGPAGGARNPRDQHRHVRLRRGRAHGGARPGRARERRDLPHRGVPGARVKREASRGARDHGHPQRPGHQQPRGADGGGAHRPAPDRRGARRGRRDLPRSRDELSGRGPWRSARTP